MRVLPTLLLALALAGLAGTAEAQRQAPPRTVPVRIIAFNDFHGQLEPPRRAVPYVGADGRETQVPAGGAGGIL